MKLLIVGGTGTLGRQVVRHALDLGHEVRCLVRSQKKAAFLKEWGAELVIGNICEPETLPAALNEIDAVIDAAAARVGDSLSIKQVDWEGKVNLINAVKTAEVNRYVFFSILNAKNYPNIPLMEIKHCTEEFIKESGRKIHDPESLRLYARLDRSICCSHSRQAIRLDRWREYRRCLYGYPRYCQICGTCC